MNRLTRELSALRAQTASVASTASSTSDLFTTSTSQPFPEPYNQSYGTGSAAYPIPTSARRHRSSSNLSTRSARSARDAAAAAVNSTSVSGVAAPRDTERSARQSLDIQRPEPGSRQNSYSLGLSTNTNSANVYRSASNATNATSPYGPPPGYGSGYGYGRHSREPSQQGIGVGLHATGSRSPSFSSVQAAARYEEAAVHRQELETVKKENETLKQKIRELEKQLAENAASSESIASLSAPATSTV